MDTLQGQFLIAAPSLVDPNFYRTILLMIQHNDEGAMALVLNRPTETHLREVWKQVSSGKCRCDGPLYHGGPCEGPLMLLHNHEPAAQIDVGNGIYFSAEQDHVQWLVEQDGGPAKAFIGYAGWAPGQLEAEFASGSWLRVPVLASAITEDPPQWDTLLMQVTPSVIEVKVMPPDPSLN